MFILLANYFLMVKINMTILNHELAEDGNNVIKNSDIEFCAENIRYSFDAFEN